MEVYITSKAFIKPSSPTPRHLRTHNLSLLDQFAPPVYIPMVLYYPNPNPILEEEEQAVGCRSRITTTNFINNVNMDLRVDDKRSQLLKQSLSKTLTHFYPLAGRIKDHISIDCNDQGAYYVEARTDSHLTHFLNKPHLSLVSKFLSSPSTWDGPTPGAPVAMIQVTVFACGGLVIGATVSHMVLDGASMSVFLNAWGAMARHYNNHHHQAYQAPDADHDHPTDQSKSEHNYDHPRILFDAPSVFPPNVAYPREANLTALLGPFFKMGKSATRRFLFDASAIARLKTKAAMTGNITSTSTTFSRAHHVQNPTRVEVVSALIWKCATMAFQANSGLTGRPSLVTLTVNMRQRAVPQFPQSLIGNLFWFTHAISSVADDDRRHSTNDDGDHFSTSLYSMVCQLREAKLKINEEFVSNLQGSGGFEHLVKVVKDSAQAFSDVVSCGDGIALTSLCRFGFYHIDFGWGKPTWISSVGSPDFESQFTNIVVLFDTRSDDGIEAWVTLDAQVIAILEQDPQLLEFASLDPSPTT